MNYPCPGCKQTFETRQALIMHRLSYHDWKRCQWEDEYGIIRVMVVAEGYAMCRRPGAVPFVIAVKHIPWEKVP